MKKANRYFVQKKIDFIKKCFDKVSIVLYDGKGNIKVEGRGARIEPYQAFMGNAQLANNLAKAVSEDYQVQFKKVEEIA